MKKGYDIAVRVSGFVLLLLAGAFLALQSPDVHSALGRRLIGSVTSRLSADISFSRIDITDFRSFTISDLLVMDPEPYTEDEFNRGWAPVDTVLSIKKLSGTVSLRSLLSKKGIYLDRAYAEGVLFHIATVPDSVSANNLEKITGKKRVPGQKPRAIPTPDVLRIRRVEVRDFNFRHTSFREDKGFWHGYGINWDDLDLVANVKGRNFRITGGRYSWITDELSAREKSGYVISKMSGRAFVGMGKVTVDRAHLVDPWSDVRFPLYTMKFESSYDFRYYPDLVDMELVLKNTDLSWETLGYFTGVLPDLKLAVGIPKAHLKGLLNDLDIFKLDFVEKSGGNAFSLSGHLTGIASKGNVHGKVKLNGTDITTGGLCSLMQNFIPGFDALDGIAPGEKFRISATANGHLNRMKVGFSLRSRIGKASAGLDVRNIADPSRKTEISGTVSTDRLNSGKFAGIRELGELSASTGFRALFDNSHTSVIIDSLKVSRLNALGYDYSGIAAAGKYSGHSFDGKIICADPNLNFIFQGIFNLSPKTANSLYKFYANIGYADLRALNLDRRGGTSKVSAQVSANFMHISKGDMIGDIDISDLVLENNGGRKEIGSISVASHSNNDINRVSIESSFLDAGYAGRPALSDLVRNIEAVSSRRELPALYPQKNGTKKTGGSPCDIAFRFHDTRDLLSFVMPGLYIADSTSLDLSIDWNSSMRAKLTSPRLAYRNNYLKDVTLDLDNIGESLNATLLSDEASLGGAGLLNTALTAYAHDNSLFTSLHYDASGKEGDSGEIYLSAELGRDERQNLTIDAKAMPSYFILGGDRWDIEESAIKYTARTLRFDNFKVSGTDQDILVSGGISRSERDSLKIGIHDIDLGVIGAFMKNDPGISGRASGQAVLTSPVKGDAVFRADIACDSLTVAGRNAGELRLAGGWDASGNTLDLKLDNILDGRETLTMNGSYAFDGRKISADLVMDDMDLALVSPFVSGIASGLEGRAGGKLHAGGSARDLSLSSEGAAFEGVRLTLVQTGVSYGIDGPFHLDDKGLWFDSLRIRDSGRGSAVLEGNIGFNGTQGPTLDASLHLSNLQLLSPSNGMDGIYGRVNASGRVDVAGPMNSISIDADISTAGNGYIHIPMNSLSAAPGGDLLSFNGREEAYTDPYEEMMKAIRIQQKQSSSDLSARCALDVSPGFEVIMDIDGNGGNRLSAMGSGNIRLDYVPSKDILDIIGDYNIAGGQYRFSIPGIVKKEFNIQEGSSVKFNGDPLDMQLDINAVYSLKTSLNKLVEDDSMAASRRTVNCGISITDKLRSPKLGFSIDVPDLNPSTRSLVESALNTEDKVQKQFIALLVSGGFIPTEQSGIVNNTTFIYANVGEIMAGQLNNILQKLEIPLDLDLGYQQSTTTSADIFDVAVSTQLFNDRVVVNGSVGNRQYGTSSNPNGEVVGDLDIDVKLDRAGRYRLNLFSHSADEYTSYLDYSQRNGAGITYQKEFRSWKDFFRDLFKGRKKRDRSNTDGAGEVTINIEGDGKR